MCRKCLIIAAGRGSRIRDVGELKPLVPVLGIPIIERVIMNVARAGIRDIYVVTGYNGKRLEEFLERLREKYHLNIRIISNNEWHKENGISVLKAEGYIGDKFLLLMGDHIVDPEIIRKLIHKEIPSDHVVLAVDRNIKNCFVNLDDVTKVHTNNGKLLRIGKDIKDYNGFDTGIFLCSPVIFEGIKESIKRNNVSSLRGGISCLAEKGMVDVVDIGERFWIDIDDGDALSKAEDMLINEVKSKSNDGPVSRYLNRPFSIRLSKLIARYSITPNHITIFSFLVAILSSFFIADGSYKWLLVGGILAQISSIIDGCDGEIARLKLMETEFGAWFDAVLDRYADAFLLGALWYHVYQDNSHTMMLLLGLMAIVGSFMVSYTADKYDAMKKANGSRGLRIGRDIRIFILFAGSVLNQPLISLIVLTILMNGVALRRILIMRSALSST